MVKPIKSFADFMVKFKTLEGVFYHYLMGVKIVADIQAWAIDDKTSFLGVRAKKFRKGQSA